MAIIFPIFIPFLLSWTTPPTIAQDLSAKEIVQRADQKARGETSRAELKMTIERPSWTRELEMKAWTKGTEYSLILVTAPPREQGTAFLKRENEIWNWQPSIDRVIKLPPSMMMQSWMGSDFTNDDLIKESSIVKDYTHELLGSEAINGYEAWKIQLTPKEDAPVVWGRIVTWITKDEFMQLRAEFYDEEGDLVNTMHGREVRQLGGRTLPSRLEVVPADEEGHKTVVEYEKLEFEVALDEDFFSIRNLKRLD